MTDKKAEFPPLVKALINTANENEIKKKQKGFLCMFSGGLDSTALLHALLTNPEYEKYDVYVHHMRLPNRENRQKAEEQAVRRIVMYYHKRKDIREFDYKESEVDFSAMNEDWSNRFSYDMDVAAFTAAQVCLARPTIKYAAMGVMKDDFEKAKVDEIARMRYQQAPVIFNAALYSFHPDIPKPKLIYPLRNLDKKTLWNSIPPNVRAMTWSCRTPSYDGTQPKRCGKCEPCIARKHEKIDS